MYVHNVLIWKGVINKMCVHSVQIWRSHQLDVCAYYSYMEEVINKMYGHTVLI